MSIYRHKRYYSLQALNKSIIENLVIKLIYMGIRLTDLYPISSGILISAAVNVLTNTLFKL